MFSFYEIVVILFIHWVADFVVQTNWQAQNKSKDNIALLSHTFTYTVVVFCGFFLLTGRGGPVTMSHLGSALAFSLVTFITHTIIDYFTSRISAKLYKDGDIHNFFVMIGLDQIMHYVQLLATYHFFFK